MTIFSSHEHLLHFPTWDRDTGASFEYQATTTTSYSGSNSPGNGSHVRVADWDMGTTEPGSSGSPLFNQDHRIIGQLHGGSAACGNDSPDWYGKFHVSMANGLAQYLDPGNTGIQFVDTLAGTAAPTSSPAPTTSPEPTQFPTQSDPPSQSPTTLAWCLNIPGKVLLEVDILTDKYPEETSWSLRNECKDEVIMTGSGYSQQRTQYEEDYCVDSNGKSINRENVRT